MTRQTTQHPDQASTRPQSGQLEGEMDAIDMLLEDHQKVRGMFEQYKKLKEEDTSGENKQALVEECCQALTLHTQLEEEIFYPAVREAIGEHDMMDEAIVEHASAKQFIAQLRRMKPDDELYDAMFTVLGEYVNHHIEEEEKEMFKKARKSGADLHAMMDEMEQRRSQLEEQMASGKSDTPKRGKRKNLH